MNDQNLLARRKATLGPTYQNFYNEPLHLVRGSGTYLWDVNGRQYIDCYNNVVSVGHCHPHVVDALCKQAAALNLYIESAEANLIGYTLWNYTADNTNDRGDQWNGEDLSIFSLSQQTDEKDINSGGRALEAVVRPFASKVAGDIIEHRFYSQEKIFVLRFKPNPLIDMPTEIFVPAFHFGDGFKVHSSSGRLTYDRRNDLLLLYLKKSELREVTLVLIANQN